jgi:hypothetical protein
MYVKNEKHKAMSFRLMSEMETSSNVLDKEIQRRIHTPTP